MNDQRDSYEATKARLEEISAAARAKDVTLEKSIELLEEAVRLANLCTEHVDQVDTFAVPADGESAEAPEQAGQTDGLAGQTGGAGTGGEPDGAVDDGEVALGDDDRVDALRSADGDAEPVVDEGFDA